MHARTGRMGMTAHSIIIAPRDPIIARDGRPFAALPGAQARSLPWPLPATIAGMVRTTIGQAATPPFDWNQGGPARAKRIAVQGPLMLVRWPESDGWQVYIAAPRDALIVRADRGDAVMCARRPDTAVPPGAGYNLAPGLVPLTVDEAGKPEGGYNYWPLEAAARWLAAADPQPQPAPPHCLGDLPHETRVHVVVDERTGTARSGTLFSTQALAFCDAPRATAPARALLCRVSTDEDWRLDAERFTTLGGERRLVELRPVRDRDPWPPCPETLHAAFRGRQRLRLALATPAIFAHGWKPGWLADGLEGSPPGIAGLRLRLISAVVSRQETVSGWDMETKKPKPARHMAPAGSVYFFEVVGGALESGHLASLWLGSISDTAQDRADGFGLALPGIW